MSEFAIPTAVVDLAAAVVIPVLVYMEDARSIRPSTMLSMYLAFTTVLDLAQARTLWIIGTSLPIAALFATRLVSKVALLILEARSKRHSLKQQYQQLPPEATAGIVNRSFQFWLNSLFIKGFRNKLTLVDLFNLDQALSGAHVGPMMKAAWLSRQRPERRFEFAYAVLKTFWKPLALAAVPRILVIGFTFAQVFLISRTLTLLGEPVTDETKSIGYTLIGATAFIYLGLAICKLHYHQIMYRFITMFRGATECCIYDHLLLLADGDGNNSATLTLMSADIDRIAGSLPELNEIWSQAIEVVIGIILLSLQLSWVSVVPIVLVIGKCIGIV